MPVVLTLLLFWFLLLAMKVTAGRLGENRFVSLFLRRESSAPPSWLRCLGRRGYWHIAVGMPSSITLNFVRGLLRHPVAVVLLSGLIESFEGPAALLLDVTLP